MLPTRAEFAACLQSSFRVMGASPLELDLELVQVSELQVIASSQVFSILFRGPSAPLMPQQIYRLRHETLGEHEVFLVPVGQEGEAMIYEAVFNRLIQAPEQEKARAPARGA